MGLYIKNLGATSKTINRAAITKTIFKFLLSWFHLMGNKLKSILRTKF